MKWKLENWVERIKEQTLENIWQKKGKQPGDNVTFKFYYDNIYQFLANTEGSYIVIGWANLERKKRDVCHFTLSYFRHKRKGKNLYVGCYEMEVGENN